MHPGTYNLRWHRSAFKPTNIQVVASRRGIETNGFAVVIKHRGYDSYICTQSQSLEVLLSACVNLTWKMSATCLGVIRD